MRPDNQKNNLFYGMEPSEWARIAHANDVDDAVNDPTYKQGLTSLWFRTIGTGLLLASLWAGNHIYKHTGSLKEEIREHNPFGSVTEAAENISRSP